MFGVSISPPNAPTSENPKSSANMMRTLGFFLTCILCTVTVFGYKYDDVVESEALNPWQGGEFSGLPD